MGKLCEKNFLHGWCDMGKIRKNPNKIGVFGVKKNLREGVDSRAGIYYIRGKSRGMPPLAKPNKPRPAEPGRKD